LVEVSSSYTKSNRHYFSRDKLYKPLLHHVDYHINTLSSDMTNINNDLLSDKINQHGTHT